MNIYDRRRRICEENHIPYYGPTQEDIDEAETYGDIQYEMYRAEQIDREQQEQSK